MPRLIDADAFEVVTAKGVSMDFADGMQYVLEMIDKAPTIEANTLVVYCKHCKHYRKSPTSNFHGKCEYFGIGKNDIVLNVYGSFFCANGERREENAVD